MKNFNQFINGSLSDTAEQTVTQQILQEGFDELYRKRWEQILQEEHGVRPAGLQVAHKRKLRYFLSIAATVLFLVVAGFLFHQNNTNKNTDLAAIYLAKKFPHPDVRKGNNDQAINHRRLAIAAYNTNDYQEAIKSYENVLKEEEGTTKDHFFLALSYLYNKENDKAIAAFLNRPQSKNFQEESIWFLSLAYLEAGKKEQAKIYLQQIVQNQWWKKKEAKRLLQEMGSL